MVNNSYVGGQVRQFGNLSFSRIFDAGHMVPYYQPETAFTVFTRIIQGDDIGMGRDVDLSSFATEGLKESLHANKKYGELPSTCWIRDSVYTCTLEEQYGIALGQGTVKDGIWTQDDVHDVPGDTAPSHSSVKTLRPTTTSSVPVTGVYTATNTPTSTPISGASSDRLRLRFSRRAILPFVPEEGEEDKRRARKMRNGLAGGLAGAGALLL